MAQRSLQVPLTVHTPSASSASSRASSQTRQLRSARTADTATDYATSKFIRSVLCAGQNEPGPKRAGGDPPISDVLPPLTSSNEVDLQLYAFIAIVIQDVVYAWYSEITSDYAFVDEVVHIIAHCTRALEERIRKTDLESLLLSEIPALLDEHLLAYRTATRTCTQGSTNDAESIYHALRPHPALDRAPGRPLGGDDDGEANFRSYCHILAQGLLAILLPTEDLQNPALRALVSEVFADLIIGNFIGVRMCESSFLYDSIRKAAEMVQSRLGNEPWAFDALEIAQDRLSRFGLLSKTRRSAAAVSSRLTLSNLFFLVIDYMWLFVIGIRTLVSAFIASSSLPKRSSVSHTPGATSFSDSPTIATSTYPVPKTGYTTPKAVLEYELWTASARLVCLPERAPWLAGLVTLVGVFLVNSPQGWGAYDSRIDRYLYHHAFTHVFPLSQHLPTILLNLRLSLFPTNTLYPPTSPTQPTTSPGLRTPRSPTSTHQTTSKAKRAAAFALLNCIPKPVARIFFAAHTQPRPTTDATSTASATIPATATGPPPRNRKRASTATRREELADAQEERDRADAEYMVRDIEETVLDVFGNAYMNRHLVLAVLERVVVAIVPELGREGDLGGGGRSVDELLAERGVGGDEEGEDM